MNDFIATVTISLNEYELLHNALQLKDERIAELVEYQKKYHEAKEYLSEASEDIKNIIDENTELKKQIELLKFNARSDQGLD